MKTNFYKTPLCYKKDRGIYSLNLKRGESITIWTEHEMIIKPRVANSIKIISK
jgi:hypothetical protein